MPLDEVVVFQQERFNCNGKDLYNLLGGGNWSFGDHTTTSTTIEKEGHDDNDHEQDCRVGSFEFLENQSEKVGHYGNWTTTTYSPPPPPPQPSSIVPHLNEWGCHYPNPYNLDRVGDASTNGSTPVNSELLSLDSSTVSLVRPKRSRHSRSKKNIEKIENQRMTHIAVERNRRKQMNEYLSILRSIMPSSYVQRGDQASIIGGAINFVKVLEQRLQWLVGQKQEKGKSELKEALCDSSPFSEFFTFPQYSTNSSRSTSSTTTVPVAMNDNPSRAENKSTIADIEVTMVESHANLKIQSRRRVPKQLLKMVSGLQCIRLTILHLNITTVDHMVLYCLSVKVEDDCKLTSVEEIATAVHQILDRIQEEALA